MKWVLVAFALMSEMALFANPTGFRRVSGEVQPPSLQAGEKMVIESGKSAVIEWDVFAIASGETVQFCQTDARSAVVNRVRGGMGSQIDGTLLSNGRIFLIDPQGIIIGSSGIIQTASFLASTLDLHRGDFFSETEMVFHGDSNKGIVNLGTIEVYEGSLFLIGPTVTNEGRLMALKGHIGLGCGREIWIRPNENEQIFIRLPTQTLQGEAREAPLQQKGALHALSVELKSGVNPYEKAIQASGKIEVLSTQEVGGRIYLLSEEGRIDSSAEMIAQQEGYERGGEISLLAKEVFLNGCAHLEASGERGGGKISIGGDSRGKNPDLSHAMHTFVGPDVSIEADATGCGDGGEIVILAKEVTSCFGSLSARGGKEGGDGGFIEVSGHCLQFQSVTDRSAPKGEPGTLLLDPINVFISNAANSANVQFTTDAYTFTNCVPNPANINVDILNLNLDGGHVTIDTSAGPASCEGAGTITIQAGANITWNTSATLLLKADANIAIDSAARIEGSGEASLTLVCDNANPTSVGPGLLIIPSDVFTIGGEFRLYASARTGNTFPPTLNEGTVTLTGSNTRLETFFPNGTYTPPYTIYFKQGELAAQTPSVAVLGTREKQAIYTVSIPSTAIDNVLSLPTSTSLSAVMQGPLAEPQDNPTDRDNTTAAEASGVQTCD